MTNHLVIKSGAKELTVTSWSEGEMEFEIDAYDRIEQIFLNKDEALKVFTFLQEHFKNHDTLPHTP